MLRLLLALVLASATSAPGAAKPRIEKQTFDHEGTTRTYYLYVPERLPGDPSLEESGMPLLLTFHGSGHNGKSLVEHWTKLADRHGFVVAGLDASESSRWGVPADGPDVVSSLVERLVDSHPIDDRRMVLFGHSAGAIFALRMGLLQSRAFAAVAVHAGAFPEPETDYAFIDAAERKVPIQIISGDRDTTFPEAMVKETAAALRARGIPLELEILEGHDHWYYDRARELNASAWEFLSRHRLSEEPSFKEYRFY